MEQTLKLGSGVSALLENPQAHGCVIHLKAVSNNLSAGS